MKLSTLLVGASLVINAVLLAALTRQALSDGSATGVAANSAAAAATPKAPAAPVRGTETWAELTAGEDAAQVRRLQDEGFPPSMVRAIMLARIRAQFAARRKALDDAAARRPFWESRNDPALAAQEVALAREQRKAVEALLGSDPEDGYAARLRRALPELPADKIAQIAQLRERNEEQRSDIFTRSRSAITAEDGDRLNALERELHSSLAAVLTPQELEAYDLRESTTANQLRYRLTAFDATEQEYRTLFRLQGDLDAQFGQRWGPGESQEAMRARRDAETQMAAQIKSALGPDRYAEYERATDFNYRRTTQLVARLNLPPQTANEIYAIQVATQQQVAAVRQTTVPVAERNAQATAIAAEAEAKISAKLGPEGFQVYKANANWLNNLGTTVWIAPPPPPPSAKK